MDVVDEREAGYTRVEIKRDQLRTVSWAELPVDASIWM
jgi:hypothetical protein